MSYRAVENIIAKYNCILVSDSLLDISNLSSINYNIKDHLCKFLFSFDEINGQAIKLVLVQLRTGKKGTSCEIVFAANMLYFLLN